MNIQNLLKLLKGEDISRLSDNLRERSILDILVDCDMSSISASRHDNIKISTPIENFYISPFDILMEDNGQKKAIIVLEGLGDIKEIDFQNIKQILSFCMPKISFLQIDGFEIISSSIKKKNKNIVFSIEEIEKETPFNFKNILNKSNDDNQEDESVDSMAKELATLRIIMQEAEDTSKELEYKIAQKIDKSNFNNKGIVNFGIARSKFNKVFDVEKVDEKVISLMSELNFSEDDIETLYKNHPNFWIPSKIDVDTLVALLQYHLQIDVRKDERFVDAITNEVKPNIENRVEFLKDLAGSNDLDLDELLDLDKSTIKTELIREALSGPTRELRNEISIALKEKIKPLAKDTASYYANARENVIKKQEEAKKIKKSLSSAKKKAKKMP